MTRKPHHFHCELYGVNIYFYLGVPSKEAVESMALHLDVDYHSEDFGGANGKALEGHNGNFIIWSKGSSRRFISVIAHECLHITNMILSSRGVGVTLENDEAQAYLMEFIFNKCLSFKSIKKDGNVAEV